MFSNYSLWTLLLSTKSVTSEPWMVAPGRLCPRPPAAGPGRGARGAHTTARLRAPTGRCPTCAFQTSGASAPSEKLPEPGRGREAGFLNRSTAAELSLQPVSRLSAPRTHARAQHAQSLPSREFPSAHVTRPRLLRVRTRSA